jgi:hypothetical protein
MLGDPVGELAADHGIVLHALAGTADLEQAFFRLIEQAGDAERPLPADGPRP